MDENSLAGAGGDSSTISAPLWGGRTASRFTAERLALLARIERSHFWFAGRRTLVLRLLAAHARPGSRVLDVGCGTGHMLAQLGACGHRVVGVDVRPEGLAAAASDPCVAGCARASAERLPFTPSSCDVVVMSDVLEHVDDRAALGEVHRVLEPRGLLLATVPAFPWLWSHRDEAAGHLRRYTRDALVRRCEEAGFEIAALRYYQFVLFPLVAMSRWLGRRRPGVRDMEDVPPRAVNAVLAAVSVLDARLGAQVRWPWGSTLVVLARKR